MRSAFAGGFFVCVFAIACLVVVEGRQPSVARAYLVQLRGPVLDSWKTELAAAGAELQDYVPQFAFRARMTPDAAARVRRLDFVASVDAVRAEHVLARRLRRNGALPYVVRLERGADVGAVQSALSRAGVQVMRRGSQFMIVADSSALESLALVDGVASIENFAPRIKHNEFGGGVIMGSNTANANGFDGSTQTIGIADTGLGTGTAAGAHASIAPQRVTSIFNWPGTPDFCFEVITNDGAQDVDSGHGTHVATAAVGAGSGSGTGRGTAPGANLIFQAIENYATPSLLCNLIYGLPEGYYLVGLPDDIGDLFDQAYQQNARVHSDSWGAEVAGAYSADSANADAFIWSHRDLAVTFSAGNSGTDEDGDGVVDPMSVNAPGTAKNVITVGASENDRQSHYECDANLAYTTCAADGGQNAIFSYGEAWAERYQVNPLRDDPSAGNAEQMAAFSSRGPTSDGRIKPDVVAPGTWTLSGYSDAFQQQYDAALNPVNGQFQYDGWGFPAGAAYKYMGGTSMAAPLVAGGAAVIRDFYQKRRGHNASAALVKAVLINSAVDLLDENNDGVLDNAEPVPNIHEGWGRVDLVNATDESDAFFDEAAPLSTASSATHTFEVTSPGVPMKVTLAWTDYPASTSAATSLVNDLDLTVTAPDGTTYRGNVFAGGWSLTGGAADRLNNVENVYVFAAAAGTWTITVTGYNVPQGPQPFALVVDTAQNASGLPMVRVTVDDNNATESGPTGGAVRFTRTGDTASALEVAYHVSGTATPGSDYVALSGFVTIPEGALDAVVAIDAIDDPFFEATESVILTASASDAYKVGSPSSGTVTINSEDLPPDFAVTAVTAPAYAAAGATITVSMTVRNQGGGEAAASQAALYLSANATLDAGDAFLTNVAVPALGVGASHVSSNSVEVPAATLPDSYKVIVKADDLNEIAESNETDNTRGSSWIKVGPDLLVSSLTAPKTAAAGETIQVADTTRNQGETPAASTTSFYLSTNTSLDAADLVLGSRAIGTLGFNGTDSGLSTLLIPSTLAPGSYYVLAKADSANAVPEYLETNNVNAGAQLKVGADLSVSALTATAEAAAGATIDVTETTSNLGAADSPASKTRYYFSTNGSIDAADTLLTERVVPALDAAASSTVTIQVTVPASTSGGQYYVIANADADQEIAETSESNNVKTFRISVGPDLLVTSIAAPDAIAPGSSFNVTDTTVNEGAGLASATQTAFYLSANAAFDASDVLIGSRAVPALAGAQSSNVTTALTMPAGTAVGLYYVIAKADNASATVEVGENNNIKVSTQVRVGPDLLVTIPNAPATVVRGVAFTVSDATSNVGVAVGSTTTSYYLSVNSALDAGDVLLGSRTVGALATGAQHAGQASVTIPAGQAPGTYYLFAKADSANVATETSETNNARSRSIKVNP